MKSKLRPSWNRSNLVLILSLSILKTTLSQSQYHNSNSKAPDYSVLSGSDPSGKVSNGVPEVKPDPLTISPRSYQIDGSDPQGQAGGQSVFYYEMYPSSGSNQKQLCTYTTSGMKCKRDSSKSHATDSFDSNGSPGTIDSYSAPYSTYQIPPGYSSTYYRTPSQNHNHKTNGIGSRQEMFSSDYNVNPSGSYGDMTEASPDSSGGGLGGLGGLFGLLGLTGLKSLIPFALSIPFLIPLFIFIKIITILPLLLLLPIPVIVSGPAAKKLGGGGEVNFKTVSLKSMIRMAVDVLDSEECVQKLSCEVGRMSRKYNVSNWTERITDVLPKDASYAKKIRQGLFRNSTLTGKDDDLKAGQLDGECSIFICKPRAIAEKYFN